MALATLYISHVASGATLWDSTNISIFTENSVAKCWSVMFRTYVNQFWFWIAISVFKETFTWWPNEEELNLNLHPTDLPQRLLKYKTC